MISDLESPTLASKREQLDVVHDLAAGLLASLDPEGQDGAVAAGQVLLGQFVVLILGQAGVVNPAYSRMAIQELGYRLGVGTVPLHSKMQRLQALDEQEGVEGAQGRAESRSSCTRALRM